eukprot:3423422-Pyramimonas_sp.AAC.1
MKSKQRESSHSDSLRVGNKYSTFADKRTGFADIDDIDNAATARAAAKSAHEWKKQVERKPPNNNPSQEQT